MTQLGLIERLGAFTRRVAKVLRGGWVSTTSRGFVPPAGVVDLWVVHKGAPGGEFFVDCTWDFAEQAWYCGDINVVESVPGAQVTHFRRVGRPD
jgi:hypothetical protein